MASYWSHNYAPNAKNRNSTCLKTFYLEGKSPWGFRIITDSSRQLIISKVRSKSKADLAGLRENDIILLINDISTQKLTLHEASDIIESAHNLCLFVLTQNNQEASRIPELNKNHSNIRLENMFVSNESDTNQGRSSHRILSSNPAFSKFQTPDLHNDGRYANRMMNNNNNKDTLLLKEIEPSNSKNERANYYYHNNNSLANQNRSNYNLRNYFSAAESNGEEDYEPRKFNTRNNFMHRDNSNHNLRNNNNNEIEKQQVSYASITLRKPLKDLNYFSDTEAFSANSSQKFRIRNSSSNNNRFQKIATSNHSLQQQQQQQKQKEKQFLRSNSLNSNNNNNNNLNPNANIYNNQRTEDNLNKRFNNLNNTNYNKIENLNNNNNFHTNQAPSRSSVSSMKDMFNQANLTDFNRKPHGFSKLTNFYGSTSPNPLQQNFQHHQQQQQQFNANVWSPPVQPQPQKIHRDEPYEDPIEARYEREMGSELAKPSSKTNYSDSYFYNSSVHNYPTIDDQKKLAKSIAETLEGSNPETSKYHLKKQKFQKQSSKDGYESEGPRSAPYYSSGNEFFPPSHEELKPTQPVNSFVYDETLPEMIKRSIAQASMNDPVRLVVAPDSFKSQHYTEHTTHTQMPPKAAMSLAHALESNQSKGGRGAQIFQKRKEKSEKWVIDETNVKRLPGQQTQIPKPQPQVYQPIPDAFVPTQNQLEHKLEQFNNQNNSKFSDFNTKPRGWSNQPEAPIVAPLNMAIDHLSHEINKETEFRKEPSVTPFEQHNPNKIDVTAWNNMKNQQQSQHQNYTISKDGIMNLKAKFYESSKTNETKPFNLVAQHQPLKTKLSSHENYLYNNKNSQHALKVSLGGNSKSSESPSSTTNNNYSSGYFSDSNNMSAYYSSYHHGDDIAASDL